MAFVFEATFDGIRLDVASTNVSDGRDNIAHTFPKRSGADLEDQGRRVRVITLALVFFDPKIDEPEDFVKRFKRFEALYEVAATRTLQHPYLGPISCKIDSLSHNADSERGPFISASATFLEDISRPPAFRAGAGVQTQVGAVDVENSRTRLNILLASLGLPPSPVAEEALAQARKWETTITTSVREVQLEAASLNDQLNAELADIQAGASLAKHAAAKEYTFLAQAVQKTSESFTSLTTRIITITVTEPLPLLLLAANVYTATQALSRAAEMRDLNPALRRLSLIPAGTAVKAYSPLVPSALLDT